MADVKAVLQAAQELATSHTGVSLLVDGKVLRLSVCKVSLRPKNPERFRLFYSYQLVANAYTDALSLSFLIQFGVLQ